MVCPHDYNIISPVLTYITRIKEHVALKDGMAHDYNYQRPKDSLQISNLLVISI